MSKQWGHGFHTGKKQGEEIGIEIETTQKTPKITEELINHHARPGEDRWQVIERLKKMLSDTTNK